VAKKISQYIVGFCVAVLLAASPPTLAWGDGALPQEVVQELNALYRTQQTDGSLPLSGPFSFFAPYPVLAALTLEVHHSRSNPAFISQSAAAATRYYSYLFTNRDRNANLLIETDLVYRDGTRLTGIEDPGFNALLSFDMVNLALLNLEMRKPFEALYWYEGARTLQERLIDRCYNVDANYFFPFDTNTGTQVHDYYALSITPLLFGGNVGDNHAKRLINHYVLRSADVAPEPPSLFLEPFAPPDSTQPEPLFDPDRLFKAFAVAATLDAYGNDAGATRAAEGALAAIEWGTLDAPTTGRRPSASARLVADLLEHGNFARISHPYAAVDIFTSIVRSKRRIADNEIVRLEESVQTIKSFTESRAAGGDVSPTDMQAVQASVRDVYWAVSKARELTGKGALFDAADTYRTSGLVVATAFHRLMDDVVYAMRRAENELYLEISRDAGFKISATLMNERAVIDQQVEIRWVVSATGRESIVLRSAEVIRGQEADSLSRSGGDIVVKPGEPQTFNTTFKARRDKVDALYPWHLTLSFRDGRGRGVRYNAIRSIYLEHPIHVEAKFPSGQILQGLSVPIDITLIKRTDEYVTLAGAWYSPSGLQVKEGNRFQVPMSADQDTTTVRMTVLVPSPCRPGSFPFKLKFYGNGKDLGTISSSLFKPYQWLFLGPFEPAEHALTTPYPPEKAVDLRKGYAGIGKRIAWRVLPETVSTNYGEVRMWGALDKPGVGYLYTVVESSVEKPECPVYLAADAPAALFFNGVRVMDYQPGPDRIPTQANIRVIRGMNNVLIKVVGDQSNRVFFKLGDDSNLASDEFNNNLWELVGDFDEFEERTRMIEAGETEDVQQLVTLRYRDPGAHSVSVIGTFNGWSPEHSRMRRSPGGSWEITLSLRPGKYAYRFLINNRQQVLDPSCANQEPDGYGGKNSIIYVMK